MSTYQSTQSLKKLYDNTLQVASRGSFLKKYSIRTESLHDLVRNMLFAHPFDSLLDVGTGNGAFIRKTAVIHPAKTYAAIDITRNAEMTGINNINYKVYDGETLPELGGPYNWILFMHMLYHVEDVEDFLTKVASKYGGSRSKILITTKSKYTMPTMDKLVRDTLNIANLGAILSPERDEAHFCSENALEILHRVFTGKTIAYTITTTKLRVTDGDDLKNYILSTPRFADCLNKLAEVDPNAFDKMLASYLPFSDTYTEAIYVVS